MRSSTQVPRKVEYVVWYLGFLDFLLLLFFGMVTLFEAQSTAFPTAGQLTLLRPAELRASALSPTQADLIGPQPLSIPTPEQAIAAFLRAWAQTHPAASGPHYTRDLGRFRATCYDLPGHTATGAPVSLSVVAVDPRVIPLHTPLAVQFVGFRVALDTGGAVIGYHIDIWRPSCAGWTNPTLEVLAP